MMPTMKNDVEILINMLEEQARLLASMHRFIQTLQGLLRVAMLTSEKVSVQYDNHIAQLNKLRAEHLAANEPVNEDDPASQ